MLLLPHASTYLMLLALMNGEDTISRVISKHLQKKLTTFNKDNTLIQTVKAVFFLPTSVNTIA